jgi:hypothetical protein
LSLAVTKENKKKKKRKKSTIAFEPEEFGI